MHHSVPVSQMGVLPSMYTFGVPPSPLEFDLGCHSTSPDMHKEDFTWELRCHRKHRERGDDEVCTAKRRRLMRTEGDTNARYQLVEGFSADSCSVDPSPATSLSAPQPCSVLPHTFLAQLTPDTNSSCMEVEVAQRRLREIEDRITLEDDSDSDLDLDVKACPWRPVLVLSDSLKENLQRGLSDILPHTVAQSVSHSCMELVLWQPPGDPFSYCKKDNVHEPHKPQRGPQEPPMNCPSPPHLTAPPVVHSSRNEEDMEM